MPASTTFLPAVPMLHTHAHTRTHTHHASSAYVYIHTRTWYNKQKVEFNWEKKMGKILRGEKQDRFDFISFYGFKYKAIFLHLFCDLNFFFFLTSALSGTCCYKSRVGFSYSQREIKKKKRVWREGWGRLPLLCLHCTCVYASNEQMKFLCIECERVYEQALFHSKPSICVCSYFVFSFSCLYFFPTTYNYSWYINVKQHYTAQSMGFSHFVCFKGNRHVCNWFTSLSLKWLIWN